ncbi:MAG: glycoside hydrolase family 88 protein [Planctomycetes bacterium]|nr:glycoside hydrolase family 88 protein [Planctomycetota bacterium]
MGSWLVLLAALFVSRERAVGQGGLVRLDSLGHAARFAEAQLAHSVSYLAANQHARSTLAGGAWRYVGAQDWTSGFFAGCQWLMYERTQGEKWRLRATQQTLDLAGQQNNTGDHDIGFRIFLSYGNAFRCTGDPAYRDVLWTAAQSLATRFNPTVGCTRSWDFGAWQFPVIIDNLMNLELLFWSAQNGGDPNGYAMARSHALRTLQEHVRPDGSTYHVVDFDPATGAVLWKGTHQGYADNSTWSRGQAWAIYGFTMTYRYTHEQVFLDGACRVAEYWLKNVPPDGVPYWDFQAPGIPNEPRDTSAAAIAAAGLLELGTAVNDPVLGSKYRQAGVALLRTLSQAPYLAEGSNSDGILLHGVGNKPANSEVDVSLIYGDYYFLEALRRL